MRLREYIDALRQDRQMTDLRGYLPGSFRGPILVGSNFQTIDDCGCMYTHMPPIGNTPSVVVTVLCDKHELGQLFAEERARLEKAWAAKGAFDPK